ncbi:MAG: recombinase family protein [Lachnospiraceae bacterium]|nr:recombinase family protein [Lachnospiraceae bacterium]
MKKIIAAYLRLSNADHDLSEKDESNSITNQRQLIKYHIQTHEDLKSYQYEEFVDDGYSGMNTNRPSFQNMLRLIKKDKIHCVIVKDLSRFARDYLVLGDYVEQIFPLLGVRFIAINDEYDSRISVTAMETVSISIKSLVYDYYSRDLARKMRTGIMERYKHGTIIHAAPYGYVTNYKKHRFEIDEEAAANVKLIFKLTIEGQSPSDIARYLNNSGVPTPAVYNRLHPELKKTGYKICKNPVWTNSSIRTIISNRTYTGVRIGHKTSTENSPHVSEKVDPADWFIYENAHTPIISEEDYELALSKLKRFTPRDPNRTKQYVNNCVLQTKLRCGHCGRAVEYRTSGRLAICPQARFLPNADSSATHPTLNITVYVYESLMPILKALLIEKERLQNEINEGKAILKRCKETLSRIEENKRQLSEKKRILYEAYVTKEMNRETYLQKKAELDKQEQDLKQEYQQQKQQEMYYTTLAIPDEINMLSASASSDIDKEFLTKDMVKTYVRTVYIDGPEDYRIEWNYDNLFRQLAGNENVD